MLTIRDAQLEALAQAKEKEFLRRAEAELRRVLPDQCDAIGAYGVRDTVAYAYELAGGYGLTRDYDILRFINLTFALGPGFDTDLPWAAELLTHPALDPSTRIDLVDQRATIELARGRGKES